MNMAPLLAGHGLDFHREEGQNCHQHNCSELLWEAVGQADQEHCPWYCRNFRF